MPDFDGETFEEARDGARLRAQLARVLAAMTSPNPNPAAHHGPHDGQGWWTLAELAAVVQAPEASVSARLRDLRKPKHGGHVVARRYCGGGVWEYRLTLKEEAQR